MKAHFYLLAKVMNKGGSEKMKKDNVLWEPAEHIEDTRSNRKMDSVTALLFQFQMIPPDFLEDKRNNVRNKIDAHLRLFGGKSAQKKYNDESETIKKVCTSVIPELEKFTTYQLLADMRRGNETKNILREILMEQKVGHKSHKHHDIQIKSPLEFSQNWLINVGRLLPECTEVIEILPFLLTCYLITALQNKLDPFREVKENEYKKYGGWSAIFQDRIENAESVVSEAQIDGSSSRKRAIDSIVNHFVLPSNCKCNAFLWTKGQPLCRFSHHKYIYIPLRREQAERCYLQCWEQYRWFACFCKACKKEHVNVNILLSAALFSSLWDKRCICYPLCKSECHCEEKRGTICQDFSEVTQIYLRRNQLQYSVEDIEQNRFSKKILSLFNQKKANAFERHITDILNSEHGR